MSAQKRVRAQRWITICLSAGVYSSAVLLGLGLIGFLIGGAKPIPALVGPAALIRQAAHGDAGAVLHLGLWLLLLTPILRVLAAAAGFLVERDHRYFLVACGVLAIIVLGLMLALPV